MRTNFLVCGCLFYLSIHFSAAQTAVSFGELSPADKALISVAGDPFAEAVVLYEAGDTYFEVIQNYIWLIKKYHGRIKVLNEKGIARGSISIPYYHKDNDTEKVENIRAVTHNGDLKTFLLPSAVQTRNTGPNQSEKTFTFPAVKKGSVLEYEYKIISPFIYNFNGWSFQSDIPKEYSEFKATIPGNYIYNRNLSGSLALDLNEAKLVRECFKIEGTLRAADCEVLKYAMKNIPAFTEEEYMLAPSNYKARIEFELAEHRRLDGVTDYYTKSWEDVDDELRNDRDLGIQLTKKGYFERNVPESLLVGGDAMTRATRIYDFVKKRFSWNGDFGIFRNTRVKEAFDLGKGNVGEINIALINLLNAGGIPTQMMLISTRAHGLPKRTHPVMTDFNYVLARATIDGKTVLLDATDPDIPFGMLPFRCLNYYGRVMDFKKGSYWEDIIINEPSRHVIRAQLTFGPGMKEGKGILDEITMGYEAMNRKEEVKEKSRQTVLEEKEAAVSGSMKLINYTQNDSSYEEKRIAERLEFSSSPQLLNGKLYVNPFLLKFFNKNPFNLASRQYPVDFGYPRTYTYNLSLVIPDGYEVMSLPKTSQIALPDQIAALKFEVNQSGNNISVLFNLALNRPHITPDHYQELKSLFEAYLQLQDNSLIFIKEKSTAE